MSFFGIGRPSQKEVELANEISDLKNEIVRLKVWSAGLECMAASDLDPDFAVQPTSSRTTELTRNMCQPRLLLLIGCVGLFNCHEHEPALFSSHHTLSANGGICFGKYHNHVK